MPPPPSKDLLESKWGPLPVWAWSLIGLGGAYLYSRYKNDKAAKTSSTSGSTATGASTSSTGTAQPGVGAPYYVIENNLPTSSTGTPSQPVHHRTRPPVTTAQPPPGNQSGPVVTTGGTSATPPGTPVPPSSPPPAPPPAAPSYIAYVVQSGDNLSQIAAKYGTTWQALWSFNTGPNSPHSSAAVAKLLAQGPNLLYSGQTIYIPS